MPHDPPVVGLHGPKGSGKTTVARHLERYHGFKRIAFADPVKDFAYNIAPTPVKWAVDLAGWDRLKRFGPFRRYLQRVGTEGGRRIIDRDVWVMVLERRARAVLADGVPVVVDDVRFENEAELIHELGGVVLHIDRASARRDDHESERPLDYAYRDATVGNNHAADEWFFVDGAEQALCRLGVLPVPCAQGPIAA